MNNKPKIAILIATFNGEKYIAQQLDSLLSQTYNDFCCYIHDDGSADGTPLIIKSYAEDHSDKIIVIDGEKCGGSKENFLFLLKKVEADYYFFCDQDDVWMPKKVEMCLGEMRKRPFEKPMVLYTDLEVVDENLELLHCSFYEYSKLNPLLNSYKHLLMSNVCVGCTMGLNRKLRDIVIDFDSKSVMMHDWEVALVASLLGEICYINIPTVKYRQHQKNVLGAAREKKILEKMVRAIEFKKYMERKKYYRNRPILMAKDLVNLPGLDEKKRSFLIEFSSIAKMNKLERIVFYKNNSLFRQRINKLWQLIGI